MIKVITLSLQNSTYPIHRCPYNLELKGCDEFAHIDEVLNINDESPKQMNRLYICPKELHQTTFINHNFPNKKKRYKNPKL